jgi:hypothetical protein
MAGNVIPQNTTIEPVRVEAYRCPVEGCERLLNGEDYDKAKAHCNQPISVELPMGFVYSMYGQITVVGRSLGITPAHCRKYRMGKIGTCDNGMGVNLYLPDRWIFEDECSSVIERGFREGNEIRFLSEEEYDIISGIEGFRKLMTEPNPSHTVVPTRTTPELERILAERGK